MDKKTGTLQIDILVKMLISGANNLENYKKKIDKLNVFPIPDGDTGTNMSSTFSSGIAQIRKDTKMSLEQLVEVFSKDMLFGARGNSGVILSQIFKGMAQAVVNIENSEGINPFSLTKIFREGVKKGYSAVLKPVEGTILTVIREITENLEKSVNVKMTITEFFEKVVEFGRKSCDGTRDKLPILKEVGVNDSGGEGLLLIFEGFLAALKGQEIGKMEINHDIHTQYFNNTEVYEGEFGFCTEFIMNLKKPKNFDREIFVKNVEKKFPDVSSLVIVQDDKVLKVHSHIPNPISLLSHVAKLGEFVKIKVENMLEQANDAKAAMVQNKKVKCGIISCNSGQGIINEMRDLGAHFIIEGGQTNNPSVSDIVNAIKKINSDVVFVLPNNSNIILSAKQASKAFEDKKIIVIPTKTQIEGLVAMLNFNEESDLADNKALMEESFESTTTIEITRASKSTKMNKVKVNENDFIGIIDHKIEFSGENLNEVTTKSIEHALNGDEELITIFYGTNASEADAEEIANQIRDKHDVEVDVKSGNQEIYHFIIGIER